MVEMNGGVNMMRGGNETYYKDSGGYEWGVSIKN